MKNQPSALDYAANLLSRYSKTEKGLKTKMKTKNYTTQEINSALNELKRLGFLNDLEYARNYAQRFEHKGNHLITKELFRKGVAKDNIEEALGELREEAERAWQAALKKWPTIKAEDTYKKKEKLSFFLVSRGFSYPTCKEVRDRIV